MLFPIKLSISYKKETMRLSSFFQKVVFTKANINILNLNVAEQQGFTDTFKVLGKLRLFFPNINESAKTMD